jgi:hypothetical protein
MFKALSFDNRRSYLITTTMAITVLLAASGDTAISTWGKHTMHVPHTFALSDQEIQFVQIVLMHKISEEGPSSRTCPASHPKSG